MEYWEQRTGMLIHAERNFLNHGLVSTVVATKGGRDVEAGVLGFEGVVGIALAVGMDKSPLREVVQIEGNALSVAPRAG